ncbi:MAG: hypothetical protein OWR62_08635 [Sulfobacillus thermotolerans]|nr:hypothetical protein [Sulfobacillus thermotolerans]
MRKKREKDHDSVWSVDNERNPAKPTSFLKKLAHGAWFIVVLVWQLIRLIFRIVWRTLIVLSIIATYVLAFVAIFSVTSEEAEKQMKRYL